MCSQGGLLTSRMRNMWSLIFYLDRAQPPLSIVLLFPSRSIGPQGMNSNHLPWGPISLLPQRGRVADKDQGAWRTLIPQSRDHLTSGDNGQTVTFSGMNSASSSIVVNIFYLVRVLVLQKSSKVLLCVSLEGKPGPCPKAAVLFLDCSSLISASLPFPD